MAQAMIFVLCGIDLIGAMQRHGKTYTASFYRPIVCWALVFFILVWGGFFR